MLPSPTTYPSSFLRPPYPTHTLTVSIRVDTHLSPLPPPASSTTRSSSSSRKQKAAALRKNVYSNTSLPRVSSVSPPHPAFCLSSLNTCTLPLPRLPLVLVLVSISSRLVSIAVSNFLFMMRDVGCACGIYERESESFDSILVHMHTRLGDRYPYYRERTRVRACVRQNVNLRGWGLFLWTWDSYRGRK